MRGDGGRREREERQRDKAKTWRKDISLLPPLTPPSLDFVILTASLSSAGFCGLRARPSHSGEAAFRGVLEAPIFSLTRGLSRRQSAGASRLQGQGWAGARQLSIHVALCTETYHAAPLSRVQEGVRNERGGWVCGSKCVK